MRTFLTCLTLAASACGGTGSLELSTWGEAYIEEQIPASTFEDGATVQYSKFLVVIRDFSLATKTGVKGPSQSSPMVVDVTKPGPTVLDTFDPLEARKWDEVSYAIAPSSNAIGVGAISAADVALMQSSGDSIRVEGTVSRDGKTKQFAWSFDVDTAYEHCTNRDYGDGVTVPTGGKAEVELTIHGDHLWYDDLQSADAKVRATAIMNADSNSDGTVTQEELQAVQLTSLPLGQYGTAGASHVKTLHDFMRALSRTIGHFRGEGECDARAR